MKSTFTIFMAVCFTVLFTTSAHAANSKGDALNECKSHLDDLYQNDVRSKVKRIKKRGSDFEVKLKVSAEGERFKTPSAHLPMATWCTPRTNRAVSSLTNSPNHDSDVFQTAA